MKSHLIAFGILLAAASHSSAAIILDPATTMETDAFTGFVTSGAQMAGMTVSVMFEDGGMERIQWVATDAVGGAAVGTGWSLSFDGPDTYMSGSPLTNLPHAWLLANNSGRGISSLLIDGQPGRVVFDLGAPFFNSPIEGTTNTRVGETFKEIADNGFGGFSVTSPLLTRLDVDAIYTYEVAIRGQAPVGDIFARLRLNFNDPGGFASGQEYRFLADTDNSVAPIAAVNPVPEPSSIALFGLGILSCFSVRRRRTL